MCSPVPIVDCDIARVTSSSCFRPPIFVLKLQLTCFGIRGYRACFRQRWLPAKQIHPSHTARSCEESDNDSATRMSKAASVDLNKALLRLLSKKNGDFAPLGLECSTRRRLLVAKYRAQENHVVPLLYCCCYSSTHHVARVDKQGRQPVKSVACGTNDISYFETPLLY